MGFEFIQNKSNEFVDGYFFFNFANRKELFRLLGGSLNFWFKDQKSDIRKKL